MSLDEKLTGREALDKATQEKGFGKPSREQELLKQKEEMEDRHAKADAETKQRDADWKAKYVDKLKENFLDKFRDDDKKSTAPEKKKPIHRNAKIKPSEFDKEEKTKPVDDDSSFNDYVNTITKNRRYN